VTDYKDHFMEPVQFGKLDLYTWFRFIRRRPPLAMLDTVPKGDGPYMKVSWCMFVEKGATKEHVAITTEIVIVSYLDLF